MTFFCRFRIWIEMSSPALPHPSRLRLPRALIVVGAPIMAALLVCVVAGSYFTQKERLRLQAQRAATAEQALSRGGRVETLVESAAAVPVLLSSLLAGARSGSDFDRVVARLGRLQRGLREVRIERVDGEMRRYTGERMFVPAPEDASRTIGQLPSGLEPEGPVTVSRLEQHLWFSQAVYRVGSHGAPLLWGYVRVALDLEAIIDDTQIKVQGGDDYQFRLSYAAAGAAPVPLQGSPDILPAPASQRIALPNGDALLLEIAPRTPWSVDPFLYVEITLTLITASLLGLFLHLLLGHPDAFLRHANSSPGDGAHAMVRRDDGTGRPRPRSGQPFA